MSDSSSNYIDALPSDLSSANDLLHSLLQVSLAPLCLLRPLYNPEDPEIADFALAYLNPAAQSLLHLPEQPGETIRSHYEPTRAFSLLAFYRGVYLAGAPSHFEMNKQTPELTHNILFSARRSGALLVVSISVTANDHCSEEEPSLRESQAREQNARADVESQRQQLYDILMHLPASFATSRGPDHVFKLVNPNYQRFFPDRILQGLPIRQALPELIGQQHISLLDRVYQTGETYYGNEIETWIDIANTGRLDKYYFNVFFQALRDPQGRIDGLLNFAVDVTEHVVARRKLQELNEELEKHISERTSQVQRAQAEAERQRLQLESLLMQAPAAICILNGPELVYELVNPAYQELFPGRKLEGKPILEALPEIYDNAVYLTFRQVYNTGQPHAEQELLIPFYRPEDGVLENRYFKYIQQALHNEQGRIDGVVVFAFEVTEQVEARKAAEASARQLRLITDALPVLVGYLDREEKYRFTNHAYEAWFNRKPEDLLGQWVKVIIGEKAYENSRKYMERALAGERLDFEARMPYRVDFSKHIRASYVPDIREGKVDGFYTMVMDITEQVEARKVVEESERQAKSLAADLVTANQQLTRINLDLDNFIYTASHDLKTPILNIESLMEAMMEELPPANLQSASLKYIIQLISDSVQRFKRTIEHLTEITKLQKENSTAESPVDLARIITEVQLDLAPAIKADGAQLEVDISNCPTIRFSEKNMRSIIYNLLSNAIKYHSPERTPVVRVYCHTTTEYLVLSVEDNGLGIELAQEAKVFGMFQRLHTHVEGSGIGLYMVKKIIDNAGGKIEVQSKVGKGTTFKVFFQRATKP
jgi:PAS domain S-box-containing protein